MRAGRRERAGVEPLGIAQDLTCDGKVRTARLDAFRRLALENVLGEIVQVLAASGVRALLLKGPAFARWLYDDPRERAYTDLDLLVNPHDVEPARAGLASLGFRSAPADGLRSNELGHDEEWTRPGPLPVAVELHHTVSGLTAEPALVWERLAAGAETIEVAGASVAVPSEVASAMIVALHAAQHASPAARRLLDRQRRLGYVNPTPGGRFAGRDLQLAVRGVDVEVWRAAAALAEELGAGPRFAVGLRLDPEGRAVADRLGLADRMPLLTQLAAGGAAAVESLIVTPGFRPRVRLVASELAPSPAFMRQTSPLARRGRLGLACAYAWRPFRLTATLTRGLQTWLRSAGPRGA